MNEGYPVVLSADRTLIADYRLLFDGMLVASQTTITPKFLMEHLLMPAVKQHNLRARVAPLGLRRIEAALLRGGFSADEVIVVPPEKVRQAIGAATRLVAISSGEPTGHGMNTTTMTEILGGRIYPEVMFRRLLRTIRRRLHQRNSPAKIVLGGPGAWQLAGDDALQQSLGIDYLVHGYAEGNVAEIFQAICAGEALPAEIYAHGVDAQDIPPIRGASTMGVVEISRGCGLGCEFCTIGQQPMQHLPFASILADAQTNLAQGNSSIALLSEDFFRYGGQGLKVNPAALLTLLRELRQLPGLRLIQTDHVNIASIARYSDEELRQVHDLLVTGQQHDFPWVNVGVETASGALLRANGGAAKMAGCPEDDWGAYCATQLQRLCNAGFFPLVSLIIGLPGETESDALTTLKWQQQLSTQRLAVFPVFHAALAGASGTLARDLRPYQWELMKRSYAQNFRWVPALYMDNQTGAGVPLWKRLLLQGMGRGQIYLWKAAFAWHQRKACQLYGAE